MIHNTHYNMIDTLIFAFGETKWKEITSTLMPLIKADMIKNVEFSSNDIQPVINKFAQEHCIHQFAQKNCINQFQGISMPVAYTLIECLFWSYKNDMYGIPTN